MSHLDPHKADGRVFVGRKVVGVKVQPLAEGVSVVALAEQLENVLVLVAAGLVSSMRGYNCVPKERVSG